MEITYFDNYEALSASANEWCREKIQTHKAKSLYVPAGQTPIGLYHLWEETKPNFLKSIQLIQIDEVIQGNKKDLFKSFFEQELPSFKKQIEFIKDKPHYADLGVLGLGTNGHVAFHEPSVDPAFSFGYVDLSESTKKHLGIEGTAEAVSYGVGAFLRTKALLLLISGKNKKLIFDRLIAGEDNIPAVWLTSHERLDVYVDQSSIT
ncbi:MAG: 6-phosphogluconolactonase [Bdellovibrionales bacterium]